MATTPGCHVNSSSQGVKGRLRQQMSECHIIWNHFQQVDHGFDLKQGSPMLAFHNIFHTRGQHEDRVLWAQLIGQGTCQ